MLAAAMLLPFAAQAQTCDPIGTFPVTYGFEESEGFATTVTGAAACTTNVFGPCWRNEETSFGATSTTTSGRIWHIYGGTTAAQIHSGTHSLMLPDKGASTAVSTTMLTFPAMNFTASNGYVVSFWIYRSGTSSNPEGFKVYASPTDTIGPNAVELGHYSRNRSIAYPTIESANGWYQYETPVITMTGTVYIIFEGQSYYGSSTYVDDVVIDVAPNCVKVANLAVDANQTTANSITLTWIDGVNTGATYTIYDMSDTSVVASNVTGTSYTVTGLTANTAYSFAVMTDCGGGDVSALTATVSGRTLCNAVAVPYSENFDNITTSTTAATGVFVDCWGYTITGTTGTSYNPQLYYSTSATYSASGTYSLRLYGNSYVTLPPMDEPLDELMVSFSVYTGSSANYKLQVGVMEGSTFVPIQEVPVASSTRTEAAVYLSEYTGNSRIIAFRNYNTTSTGYSYQYIDNLLVDYLPSCIPVNNLVVDSVSTTSITLSWTDASNTGATYTVVDNTGVVASGITGTTYIVENLTDNTEYTFGVVANCSATDNSDTITVTARTACGAITTLPYVEGFESFAANEMPSCWDKPVSAASISVQSSAANAHDGTKYLRFYSGTGRYAVMPVIDLPSDGVRVTFWTRPESITSASCADFQVGYITDATDVTTFVATGTYHYNDWTTAVHEEKYVDMTNIPAGARIAFYHTGTSNWYWYLDDITVDVIPSCPAPIELAASLTPGNGSVATLAWHENGTATAWQVCLNDDMTNLIDVYDTTLSLTGLTPEVAVTAKVRSVCDASDMSPWSNSITFTPTNAYMLTVNDGTVTNGYVPVYGLWVDDITKSQFIIPATDLASLQFGNITKLTFYASEASINWGAASFNVYLTETSETTVSTLADYTAMTQVYTGSLSINNGKMEVTFTTPYTYMGGNLMIGFLQTVSGTYSSCSWYGVTATGASQGGYGSSISQQNFLPKTTIGFTPGTMPDCLPVTGLAASNVTTDGATLSWNSSADSYNVYILDDTNATFVQNVTNTTITLSGLNAMTQYSYGVRAVCGSSESNIVVVNFTTACAAVNLPYVESFEPASATRNCWDFVSNNTENVGGSYGMGFVTLNGNTMWRFSSYSNASDYNQYGYSPELSVSSSATALNVKVRYATYGSGDQLTFGYVTATDTVWETSYHTTTGDSDFQYLETLVPANVVKLAVKYYGSYSYYAWIDSVWVSEVTAAYCAPVTGLTATAVTDSTVTISWTSDAASFDIYNDSVVVAAGITTTSYTFTGLAAATNYTFGVVANCSATNVSDIVTINVATACADITVLPYNEGFENDLGCWTTVNGSSDGTPWFTTNCAGLDGVTPHGGNYVVSSWSWNSYAMHANAWLISPKFVLPTVSAGDSLVFTWWERTSSGYPDSYSVLLSTTTNDTAAFTTVVRPYGVAGSSWTIQNVDLTAYAGQSVYLAFHHVDYDENYLLIDDISLTVGAAPMPAPDTLTVIFSVNDSTMGTTTPAPGTYQYLEGDTVFFSATPTAGHHFTGWVMGYAGYTDTLGSEYISASVPAAVLMGVGDITFEAMFEVGNPDSSTITYAVNDATMGTTTPAPGTYTIYVGSAVEASATANAGYMLDAWVLDILQAGVVRSSDTITSDDPDFDNPISFGIMPQTLVDAGATVAITAIFVVDTNYVPTTYTVTLSSADATMGSVSPAGANTVNEGATFTATATALDGYHFVAWVNASDQQVSTDNPYTFTVTEDVALVATFAENDPAIVYYEVAVSSADNTMGTVTATASGQVAENTEVTVTATAAAGYHFVSWVNETGAEVSTENPYTFTVTGNVTLVATFAADEPQGIEDVNSVNIYAYSFEGNIVLKGAEGREVRVFDLSGRMLHHTAVATDTEVFKAPVSGAYLIKTGNVTKRVVVVK